MFFHTLLFLHFSTTAFILTVILRVHVGVIVNTKLTVLFGSTIDRPTFEAISSLCRGCYSNGVVLIARQAIQGDLFIKNTSLQDFNFLCKRKITVGNCQFWLLRLKVTKIEQFWNYLDNRVFSIITNQTNPQKTPKSSCHKIDKCRTNSSKV